MDKSSLFNISNKESTPILMVGLSKTYHPKYHQSQVGEMARMYWDLNKFSNTSLPKLLGNKAFLVAWSSKLNGKPMVIGAWCIAAGEAIYHDNSGRYEFPIKDDNRVRQLFMGKRLEGTGNSWQGPRIYVPS
ncbi:hypothetical protein ACWXWU_15510 [Shewanella sp. A14]